MALIGTGPVDSARPADSAGPAGSAGPVDSTGPADSTGPVAVVTGAARGMGAATARRLASAGWRLVLVDRCADDTGLRYPLASPAELEAVVADCGGHGRAIGVVGDTRSQTDLEAAVADGVGRFGGLDAAVAVAGAIRGGRTGWDTDDETWSTMIGINLEGPWRLARAAIPAILARPAPRRGRFVAVASAGGSLGLPLLAAYCAAKSGVLGLVRSLAVELGPHGVTANAVSPGSTTTAMLEASARVYNLDDVDDFVVHHPLGRLLAPEEPAALIAWLCSPDAGGITGANLPVDAGMTAH